ncbi:hypothetical protein EWM64_g8767 [Hericium alpestre]|uniref:Rhodanese domain-containing protein n=1 Tax=Hericium alpestre TaxID=135208 RepID=A0A4Y9ZKW3_9AGAM|nr:hypothetical protein EWM64_g8767 [Hericium alpestre]
MSTSTIRKTHTRSSSTASSGSRDSLSLSRGERPLSFQNFQAYHREALSDSSVTTPVFSPKFATLEPKPSPIYDPLPQRTIEDIRDEVAARLAVRVVRKIKLVDDTKVSVALTLSKQDDAQFLRIVAGHLQPTMALKSYLFAIATTGTGPTALIFCGSSPIQVQRAALIASSKFIGRVQALYDEGTRWIARVHDIGWTPYDETALWDVVQKSAQQLIDPSLPPPGSRSINDMLGDGAARLQRITPRQAFDELHDISIPMPVLLVDIRPQAQREQFGWIRGSLVIERNVLEWRFDPRARVEDGRLEIANRYDLRVIVLCQEGYTSSLAAAALQDLGLLNATDIDGGYKAWVEAALPIEISPVWPQTGRLSI